MSLLLVYAHYVKHVGIEIGIFIYLLIFYENLMYVKIDIDEFFLVNFSKWARFN